MTGKSHWDRVYGARAPEALSWFQPQAERSLRWIAEAGLAPSASIIDVGGGASILVDGLLARGFTDLWVLDLSAVALARARERLGAEAERVRWLEADVTQAELPAAYFDLWHDRAVFHFLTEPDQRSAYVAALGRALKPGGQVIMATFAEDGPSRCSGLPVVRYRPETLQAELGDDFELLHHEKEAHRTPAGAVQEFLYCRFRRRP